MTLGEVADDEAAEVAEEAQLDDLAALLDDLDRHQARRWITVAAFGLTVVATSTLLHHWTAAGPVGPLGRLGLPLVAWLGLVPAAVALVLVTVRPDAAGPKAPWIVLAGAVVIGIATAGPLSADRSGPAPWLALCGALVAGTAALAQLVARR
jgi:hypothetical protein